MMSQVQSLLLLQEIDALLQDLADAKNRAKEKALGFSLGSTTGLDAERARIAQGLSPEVVQRYEQVRRRHARAVAPVRRGVCLGCFTVRPTKSALPFHGLDICERCGRILFRSAEPSRPASPAPAVPVRGKQRRSPAAPRPQRGSGKSA
jgi:predicted  nucleic acid-binding Zn-ribbon protein